MEGGRERAAAAGWQGERAGAAGGVHAAFVGAPVAALEQAFTEQKLGCVEGERGVKAGTGVAHEFERAPPCDKGFPRSFGC